MPDTRNAPAWLAWFLLPLVVAGFAALWTLASLYADRQCSFMAVVGAVDVLWALGLAPRLGPVARGLVAVVATVALVLLANWSIIAIHVGVPLGNGPLDAMSRLGTHHAWTMASLANDWRDAVWIALALGVAGGWPWFSARRRALSAR